MNAILPHQMPLGDMQTLAVAIAKSALFGIRTPEQALVLMAIAQAEGRHPVEAARDYDIINNRPAKKAEAMLRDFIKAGGKVQWHSLTDEKADATFTHPQTGEVRIDWDRQRAENAFGKKDMYSKFPRQMLRSRVVSEGVRTLWPLATSGMYEPGEAADIPEERHNGPTLEASPEREAINREIPMQAAAAATPRPPRKAEQDKPVQRTDEQWDAWLDKLRAACAVLQRRSEVEDVAARPTVSNALADKDTPPFVKREIDAILVENFRRFPDEEAAFDDDPFAPGLEIAGADKLAAG